MTDVSTATGTNGTGAAAGTQGLTYEEAAARLGRDGYNELPDRDTRSFRRILADVLKEPMLSLLLAAGGIYLTLGDRVEAGILLLFATFSVLVSVIQEARSERVIAALRNLASPRALVVRSGVPVRIPGRDVVRGDLLLLEQGDRVPADARLVQAADLQCDESLLTGESLPVDKRAGEDAYAAILSGTLIVRGAGRATVVATGAATELGRIGGKLAAIDPEPPRLRAETAAIVRLAGLGGLSVALAVTGLIALSGSDWLQAALAGIATGMAMLPEEFPVVLTTFLAMGAWRISRVRVLARRPAAIETLGSITILCSDKTGTLTCNQMEVDRVWLPSGETASLKGGEALGEAFHSLLQSGALASAVLPTDPMEAAIHRVRDAGATALPPLHPPGWEMVRQFGLRPELMAMSNVWSLGNDDGPLMIAAKGAPEAVARLCRLGRDARKRLTAAADAMAEDGIRVLGVATARAGAHAIGTDHLAHRFALSGLIGFADPLRAGVRDAVAECRKAGIRVIMITGDYPVTAGAIARQAGLADGSLLTGSEIDAMDDTALAVSLAEATVFARITPMQKLRIVETLKRRGEVVAMTGDGVNDAPSLKAAHVGIAMGGRGTDVAREAAALVLLDDNFTSIVEAIRLGRRIYANIRKAVAFIVAVHVPIAGLALLPLVLGQPLLLGPIQIALLEMVIDPACALVFEAEKENSGTMRRPPREPDARLMSGPLLRASVLQGACVLGVVAGIYLWGLRQGMPPAEVRSQTFLTLVLSTLALIQINRGSRGNGPRLQMPSNRLFLWLIGVTGAFLAAVLFNPALRSALQFGNVSALGIGLAFAAGGVLALVLKRIRFDG